MGSCLTRAISRLGLPSSVWVSVTTMLPGLSSDARAESLLMSSLEKHVELANTRSPSVQAASSHSNGSRSSPPLPWRPTLCGRSLSVDKKSPSKRVTAANDPAGPPPCSASPRDLRAPPREIPRETSRGASREASPRDFKRAGSDLCLSSSTRALSVAATESGPGSACGAPRVAGAGSAGAGGLVEGAGFLLGLPYLLGFEATHSTNLSRAARLASTSGVRSSRPRHSRKPAGPWPRRSAAARTARPVPWPRSMKSAPGGGFASSRIIAKEKKSTSP
mmetsp:Transcript_10790/g.25232  ORF Transcript_10790/g.25232 Transcript_10790/m.25232 type:complete len:277 (+) Transcript_10790:377-1207(+)